MLKCVKNKVFFEKKFNDDEGKKYRKMDHFVHNFLSCCAGNCGM